MRRTIVRALIIVLAGAGLGLAVNAWSPNRIPYVAPAKTQLATNEVVTLAEAGAAWTNSVALFLDARAPADYAAGHLANALSLPVEDFDRQYLAVAPQLAPDSPIIVYCDGLDCDLSQRLAAKLRDRGYRQVRVLVNGWTRWRQAGLATHTGPQP